VWEAEHLTVARLLRSLLCQQATFAASAKKRVELLDHLVAGGE
jgi:hypothetical protein